MVDPGSFVRPSIRMHLSVHTGGSREQSRAQSRARSTQHTAHSTERAEHSTEHSTERAQQRRAQQSTERAEHRESTAEQRVAAPSEDSSLNQKGEGSSVLVFSHHTPPGASTLVVFRRSPWSGGIPFAAAVACFPNHSQLLSGTDN